MPRARPSHAAGQNFSALLHEWLENFRLLVVDQIDLLDAEPAHFLLAHKIALATAGPSRTRASWPRRSWTGWPGMTRRRGCLLLWCGWRFVRHWFSRYPLAAACSGAGVAAGVAVLRGRRAARRSRRFDNFCCRLISSSRRIVKYLITASETCRRRSSSLRSSPWLERSSMYTKNPSRSL